MRPQRDRDHREPGHGPEKRDRTTPIAAHPFCDPHQSDGSRNGAWADLMKPAVARLTLDDMVAIAAYAASRAP